MVFESLGCVMLYIAVLSRLFLLGLEGLWADENLAELVLILKRESSGLCHS